MSQHSRRELLAVVEPRYRAAQGTDRKRILDEFVASSGYHRKYALQLLNHPPEALPARKKRHRTHQYSLPVQRALITCWRATNGICSKRLVPYLPELVAVLEQHGELQLDAQTKTQLLSLSPATADRLALVIVGIIKGKLAQLNLFRSTLEIVLVGILSAGGGYVLGTLIPKLFGL